MRYRKLTTSGDYSFGSGQLDFWRDVPEAVGQAVETRLLLWLGEWYLNIEDGTPYMQGILGKHSQDVADMTIRQRILDTQGMESLASYQSTLDSENRMDLVETLLNTIYGPTALQVDNYANY